MVLKWQNFKIPSTKFSTKSWELYSRTCSICNVYIIRICRISIAGCDTCCDVISTNFDTLHVICKFQATNYLLRKSGLARSMKQKDLHAGKANLYCRREGLLRSLFALNQKQIKQYRTAQNSILLIIKLSEEISSSLLIASNQKSQCNQRKTTDSNQMSPELNLKTTISPKICPHWLGCVALPDCDCMPLWSG